jgi:hypothetical protein
MREDPVELMDGDPRDRAAGSPIGRHRPDRGLGVGRGEQIHRPDGLVDRHGPLGREMLAAADRIAAEYGWFSG